MNKKVITVLLIVGIIIIALFFVLKNHNSDSIKSVFMRDHIIYDFGNNVFLEDYHKKEDVVYCNDGNLKQVDGETGDYYTLDLDTLCSGNFTKFIYTKNLLAVYDESKVYLIDLTNRELQETYTIDSFESNYDINSFETVDLEE